MKYFGKRRCNMQENEVVIRLLRNIMCNLSTIMNHYYEPYGITGVQCQVMMEIAENGGEIRTSELAKHLQMGNSNLSAIIKRMERHDLLIRRRNPMDERIVMVSLSEKSKHCMAEMQKDLHGHFDLLEPLKQQEKDDIIKCLQMLNQAIVGGVQHEEHK